MKIQETRYYCDICKKEIAALDNATLDPNDPMYLQKVIERKQATNLFRCVNDHVGEKECLICNSCAKAISAFIEVLKQSCN